MKNQWHYSLIVPIALVLLHQALQHWFKVAIPFLDAYLDPFCLGALALHGVRFERRFLFNRPLLPVDALAIILFLAIISEGLFPYLSDKFTRDAWDVAAIVGGALWFTFTTPHAFGITPKD